MRAEHAAVQRATPPHARHCHAARECEQRVGLPLLHRLALVKPTVQAELDEVVLLIDTLAGALGNREYTQAAQHQATVIRAKAFELLVSLYEDVRAGVLYVRRKHGDADEIAPSPYANRALASKRPAEEEDPTTGVHPVVQPAPSEPASGPAAPSLTEALNNSLAQSGPIKRSGQG
jgi:hypothetical protein